MAWETPVTDRTQEDVDRVDELNEKWLNGTITDEEKVEFSVNMKGALNFEDLERIQGNMQEVSDLLGLGLTVTTPFEDLFRQSLLDEIIDNIDTLTTNYSFVVGDIDCTIPDDVNEYAHYCYWNWVELIQERIYNWASSKYYYYTGTEIYTGEETGLLL